MKKSKGKSNVKLAKNLMFLLNCYGMKQIELSQLLKVSKGAISNYTSGKSRPSSKNLEKIAKIFDVPMDELLHSEINILTPLTADSGMIVKMQEHAPEPFAVPVFFPYQLKNTEDLFHVENFMGKIAFPAPVHGFDECYAVFVLDNLLASTGISKRCYAIFSITDAELKENELVAVFMQSIKKVVVRRISFGKECIVFKTDSTEEIFSKSPEGDDFQILGKIVSATFSPQ